MEVFAPKKLKGSFPQKLSRKGYIEQKRRRINNKRSQRPPVSQHAEPKCQSTKKNLITTRISKRCVTSEQICRTPKEKLSIFEDLLQGANVGNSLVTARITLLTDILIVNQMMTQLMNVRWKH